MFKESTISKLIRENRLNNISSALDDVNDAISLLENILASASEYFEELDRFYDEIMKLKYIGQAPTAYSRISTNKFRLLIVVKKCEAIKVRLEQDEELRDATARINEFLRRKRMFKELGLNISYGEMSAKDVLFNYYKLVETKKDLELRSNLYKR